MARFVMSLLLGLLFGIGLLLSGMSDPIKVQGFLDISGLWDPSLAFVMGGAIGVSAPVFAVLSGRTKSWLGDEISTVRRTRIDKPLLVGSLLFGIGWGLAGFCPGPALVGLGGRVFAGNRIRAGGGGRDETAESAPSVAE